MVRRAPWHARLQGHLVAAEAAVAALRAACEEPEAREALEVRRSVAAVMPPAQAQAQAARARASLVLHACAQRSCVPVRGLMFVTCAPDRVLGPQARDAGFVDHATAALLHTDALLQRADVVAGDLRNARAVLAWRTPGDAQHSALHDSAPKEVTLSSMPHALAVEIFKLLPADARARAALVCRAWRSLLAKPGAWLRLDLSPASGVELPVSDDVLLGAAAKARSGLETLVLDDCRELSPRTLLKVVAANAATLRELRLCFFNEIAEFSPLCTWLEKLMIAAPQLTLCVADADGSEDLDLTLRMLRHQPPFGALQLRSLALFREADEDKLLAVAAAIADYASLQQLTLSRSFTQLEIPVLRANFMKAVLSCKLKRLKLLGCRLSAASVPVLAQVVRRGELAFLWINNCGYSLLDEDTASELADAIGQNRTLTRLVLQNVNFWEFEHAAKAVIRALTGHPTICNINLVQNGVREGDQLRAEDAGTELRALVAANTPALRELHVHSSIYGDAGLAPLIKALPDNTHLRVLQCANTGMSTVFARECFLPAVRMNKSLRKLTASPYWGNQDPGVAPPEVLEAEALVAARAAAE